MRTKGYLFTAYMIWTGIKSVGSVIWRYKREAFAVVGVILALGIVIFTFRACNKPAPVKVDVEQVERINKANEIERRQELREVIIENADVIATTDERTTIANANVEQRDAEIDAKVIEADKRIAEAKQQGRDITERELKCLLGSKEYCE